MKIVFAGPSLHGSTYRIDGDIELRPPARQGDVFKAVGDGANVIGLVDGVYEQVPAIWHKEILHALSEGVRVFGAASLGALRAAECAAFGMVGVGRIFEDYRDGRREDDADVALTHGPRELGYQPLSEPLVNVEATLEFHLENGSLTLEEFHRMLSAARALFFKERTWRTILGNSALPPHADLLRILTRDGVNQKRADAELLLVHVAAAGDKRGPAPAGWDFAHTSFFEAGWLG